MHDTFLQESPATVLVFDLRGFTGMAARLGPVDLGATLGRFYEHVEAAVERGGGRLVKFVGDVVVAVWIGGNHQDGAMKAIRAARESKAAWLAENQRLGLADLSYSMAAASGTVLAGHIGTAKMRAFDILGTPVNVATKLALTATARDVDNLVTADALGSDRGGIVEVEGIELGGTIHRLYRVD